MGRVRVFITYGLWSNKTIIKIYQILVVRENEVTRLRVNDLSLWILLGGIAIGTYELHTQINTMNVWSGRLRGAGMEWLTLLSYFNR